MSAPALFQNQPDPAHEGIESYSVSCALSGADELSQEELREFAASLVREVSRACEDQGAVDIGHVKAHLSTGEGYLYADAVGEAGNVSVAGRGGAVSYPLRLTLNAVVCGVDAEALRQATERALERVLDTFRFERSDR